MASLLELFELIVFGKELNLVHPFIMEIALIINIHLNN
jgi:hypothetical protein